MPNSLNREALRHKDEPGPRAIPVSNECRVVTSWTNGRKAIVHLLAKPNGDTLIRKVYRRGFLAAMLREYFMTTYIACRLPSTLRVLGFNPWRKELFLSYVTGQRVLEWVLER